MASSMSTNVLDHPTHASSPNPSIITADEAGSLVGLSGRTIRRLCNDGSIPNAVQLGRSWRINRATFLQLFGITE